MDSFSANPSRPSPSAITEWKGLNNTVGFLLLIFKKVLGPSEGGQSKNEI
jgi:hypothetical protein